MKILDLENKWFYRLVKVMYIFFLAIGLVGVLCIGWSSKPYQLVDNKRSFLTCPDGTKHTFQSFDLYFYSKEKFSDYDVEKAIGTCNKKHLKKGEAVTDLTLIKFLDADKHWEENNRDPYPTHWIYKTEGSWIEATEWGLLGSIVTFLILTVIKQSLLYIVYGKKFTLGCRKKS